MLGTVTQKSFELAKSTNPLQVEVQLKDKPLLAILGPTKNIPSLAAARLQCWVVLLSAYMYTMEYKSTVRHGNADALSHLPLPGHDTTFSVPACFNVGQIQALPITSTTIRVAGLLKCQRHSSPTIGSME